MKGADLLDLLIESTELPQFLIRKELQKLLSHNGIHVEDLNLHILRELMTDYLQDNLPMIKNSIS